MQVIKIRVKAFSITYKGHYLHIKAHDFTKFKQQVSQCLASPKVIYATMQKLHTFLMLFRRGP